MRFSTCTVDSEKHAVALFKRLFRHTKLNVPAHTTFSNFFLSTHSFSIHNFWISFPRRRTEHIYSGNILFRIFILSWARRTHKWEQYGYSISLWSSSSAMFTTLALFSSSVSSWSCTWNESKLWDLRIEYNTIVSVICRRIQTRISC